MVLLKLRISRLPSRKVRCICDAFGTGYWYIPGTETCIKIGGSVEFTTNFHALNVVLSGTPNHSSNWDFVTEAKLNFTAKSMTDYGELVGYVGLVADYNNNGVATTWGLDNAWLAIGPLMAGHQSSTFDYGGDFAGAIYRSDVGVDQIRLSWAMGGFGIMLGIEDPRDRWGTSLSSTYNMPDLVAAVTASQDKWSGKLAVGFASVSSVSGGSAWGILGGIDINSTRSRLVTCCASRAPTVTALTPSRPSPRRTTPGAFTGSDPLLDPDAVLRLRRDLRVDVPDGLGLGLRRQPGLGSGFGLQRETAG